MFETEKRLRDYYLIDINPSIILNIDKICDMTLLSIKDISNMTFRNVLLKLFSYEEILEMHSSSFITNNIYKKRRFCPECLRLDGAYKLIWQIREIEICDIHNIKLESMCKCCSHEQPLVHHLIDRAICVKCGHSLFDFEDIKFSMDYITKQLSMYEDWNYLLDPGTSIGATLPGLNKLQSMAAKLLYIAQGYENIYKYSSIKHIDNTYKKRLLRITKSSRSLNPSIKSALHLLRKVNMSLIEFSNLEIPVDFISSLFPKSPVTPGPCLTPWCSSLGSNETMREVENLNLNRHKYKEPSICTKCFIKYGYSKETGKWEEIGSYIDLVWNKIRKLLLDKFTIYEICKTVGISQNLAFQMVGYLNYHNLLQDMYESPRKKQVPKDLVARFEILAKKTIILDEMYRYAREMFGWRYYEFYYYFASNEVQMFWYFESHRYRKRGKRKWEQEVRDKIKDFLVENRVISVKAIAEELNTHIGVLHKNGLFPLIKMEVEKQKRLRYVLLNEQIWRTAKDFVKLKKEKNKIIKVEEFCSFIGRTLSWLRKNYLEIADWISLEARISRGIKK